MRMRAKDGGALPDTGCPTRRRYGNGEHARKHVRHGANASISYNAHAFIHGCRLGVIPSKRALSEWFGSSGVVVHDRHGKQWYSAMVEEVVVHATVIELDDTVTRVFGNGSGTHFVVVHIP